MSASKRIGQALVSAAKPKPKFKTVVPELLKAPTEVVPPLYQQPIERFERARLQEQQLLRLSEDLGPPEAVDEIVFGLVSPELIEDQTRGILIDKDASSGAGSVNDPRLGPIGKNTTCETCGKDSSECPGHFGYIELNREVINPAFMDVVIHVLGSICVYCGKTKLGREAIEEKFSKYKGTYRLKAIFEASRGILKGCKADASEDDPQPEGMCLIYTEGEVKSCGQHSIYDLSQSKQNGEVYYKPAKGSPTTIYPVEKVKTIFNCLSNRTAELLGFNPPMSHPRNLILSKIVVTSTLTRPARPGSSGEDPDQLTKLYRDIVAKNLRLAAVNKDDKLGQNKYDTLKRAIADLFNHFRDQIKGKNNLLRGHMSGKRVDYSGRTVLTPDPTLRFGQISIPKSWAATLLTEEPVYTHNLTLLNEKLRQGKIAWIIPHEGDEKGKKFSVQKRRNYKLKIGDRVLRHLETGDYLIGNRQPTLFKQSFLGNQVVLRDQLTIGIHQTSNDPLHADHDGDEGNIHILQHYKATAEAIHLMSIRQCINNPQTSRTIVGIILESLVGAYLMTRPGTIVDSDTYNTALMQITRKDQLVSLDQRLRRFGLIDIENHKETFYKLLKNHGIKEADLAELKQYIDNVEGNSLREKVNNYLRQNDVTAPIRDSLFPRFFEGEYDETVKKIVTDFDHNRVDRVDVQLETMVEARRFALSKALGDYKVLRDQLLDAVGRGAEIEAVELLSAYENGNQLVDFVKKHLQLSQIYKILEKIDLRAIETTRPGAALFSAILPVDFNYKKAEEIDGKTNVVIIQNGILVQGFITAEMVGPSKANTIIAAMNASHGTERTGDFITDLTFITYSYMEGRVSISLRDCMVMDKKVLDEINKKVAEISLKVNALGLTSVEDIDERARNEKVITGHLNQANIIGTKISSTLGEDNAFNIMKIAKGGDVQIMQGLAMVGQKFMSGARIGVNTEKGLKQVSPYFTNYAGLEAQGFVVQGYFQGLSPQDYFHEVMASRETVINTAMRTGEVGYIRNRMAKVFENFVVTYDGSIRNLADKIFQPVYGEDGFDAENLFWVSSKRGKYTFFIDVRSTVFDINSRYGFYETQQPAVPRLELITGKLSEEAKLKILELVPLTVLIDSLFEERFEIKSIEEVFKSVPGEYFTQLIGNPEDKVKALRDLIHDWIDNGVPILISDRRIVMEWITKIPGEVIPKLRGELDALTVPDTGLTPGQINDLVAKSLNGTILDTEPRMKRRFTNVLSSALFENIRPETIKPRKLTENEIKRLSRSIPGVNGPVKSTRNDVRRELIRTLEELLSGIQITPLGLSELENRIVAAYNSAKIAGGSPAGMTAVDACSQPLTQMMLKNANAGTDPRIGTTPVDSLREIINVSKNRRVITSTIHFKNKTMNFDRIMDKMADLIGVTIQDLIEDMPLVENLEDVELPWWHEMVVRVKEIEIPQSDMVMIIKLNQRKMLEHKITMSDIEEAFQTRNVLQAATIVASPLSESVLYIYPEQRLIAEAIKSRDIAVLEGGSLTEVDEMYYLNLHLLPVFSEVHVKGITEIKSIFPEKANVPQIILSESRDSSGWWKMYLNPVLIATSGIEPINLAILCRKIGIEVLEIQETASDFDDLNDVLERYNDSGFQTITMGTKSTVEIDRAETGVRLVSRREPRLVVRLPAGIETKPSEYIANQIAEDRKRLDREEDEEFRKGKFVIRTSPIQDASKYYFAITRGSNLITILGRDDVDSRYTTSNDLHENMEIFGVEAVRNIMIRELLEIYGATRINPRHVVLIVDFICSKGTLTPITYKGISEQPAGALSKASFQRPMDELKKGGVVGQVNPMIDTSSAVFSGRNIQLGTGYTFDILFSEDDLLQEYLKSIETDGPVSSNEANRGIGNILGTTTTTALDSRHYPVGPPSEEVQFPERDLTINPIQVLPSEPTISSSEPQSIFTQEGIIACASITDKPLEEIPFEDIVGYIIIGPIGTFPQSMSLLPELSLDTFAPLPSPNLVLDIPDLEYDLDLFLAWAKQ